MKNYINYLKNIKGYTDGTIKIYLKYAKILQNFDLNYQLAMEKYTNVSNTTKRVILSSFKKYLFFLKNSKYQEIELPKKEIKIKTFITYEEYQEISSMIKKENFLGFQKYLILKILFETGIRASELLKISKTDIQNNKIKIHGKGNKERYVYISKWLNFELQNYLKKITTKKLFNFTYKNLYQKIKKINNKYKLSPHILRRSFANYCLLKGISIYDISLTMGHNNINTTSHYLNRDSQDVNISQLFH